MHITDEFVRTAMGICLWAVPVVMVVGAAGPIFLPPRRIRSWPYFTRPLVGAVTAQAAVCGLMFGVVRPLIGAQFEAHGGNIILDYPVDMLPPALLLIGAVVVSYILFAIHAVCRSLLRDRHAHATK